MGINRKIHNISKVYNYMLLLFLLFVLYFSQILCSLFAGGALHAGINWSCRLSRGIIRFWHRLRFSQVLNFEIGTTNIVFSILEELWIQIKWASVIFFRWRCL